MPTLFPGAPLTKGNLNMRIVETYSHFNGLEYLMVQKPSLLQEIRTAISSVDIAACLASESMPGESRYASDKMILLFSKHFHQHGWDDPRIAFSVIREEQVVQRTLAMSAEIPQTDFVKDRVAVEIQFGKYAFVAYDLFVKHLAFYVSDQIDVGVEILPMKALQAQMSSGVGYYEGELYNVVRQGRGVPAVPLVIIGIEP